MYLLKLLGHEASSPKSNKSATIARTEAKKNKGKILRTDLLACFITRRPCAFLLDGSTPYVALGLASLASWVA